MKRDRVISARLSAGAAAATALVQALMALQSAARVHALHTSTMAFAAPRTAPVAPPTTTRLSGSTRAGPRVLSSARTDLRMSSLRRRNSRDHRGSLNFEMFRYTPRGGTYDSISGDALHVASAPHRRATARPKTKIAATTATPASGSASLEPRPDASTDNDPPPGFFLLRSCASLLRRLRRKVAAIPEGAGDEGRFLFMAAFVGVLTGTAVTAFKILIGVTKELSYGDLISRFPADASKYAVGIIPVLGAVVVVSLMKIFGLKTYGPGLGGLTEEVDKQVPWRPKRTVGKTLAAVATLGTGNSLGPEGPAVELGVAASRFASSMSNLSVERQRMLFGAGAAAGVAAGFNAPIAGIFFALEIVKNTFNSNVNSKSFIAGTLLCSVVSALIAKIGLHDELALRPAAYHLESPLVELPLYLGLGVVAGLVAVMFKFFSRKSGDIFAGKVTGFRWMKTAPKWSKPLMMAAITGIVGVLYPQVLFFGYDTLDNLLANTGSYGVGLLGFLCVAKALLTAGALGSGLVGGTFAPSLFLGATAGAAYQQILQGSLSAFRNAAGPSLTTFSGRLLPFTSRLGLGDPTGDLVSLLTIAGPPAYAMVGAAAVLSALYRAPLTGSLLLFELTKDYDIVLPLMAAAGVSSLVVELFSLADGETIETSPMPRDMSLEIGLKISGKVDELMGKVQVGDALVPRVLVLTADVPLSDAVRAFRLTRNEFAVVVCSDVLEAQARADGDGSALKAQTLLAEDMWERRDLQLIGVLALREIIGALEQEREDLAHDPGAPRLTAGSMCRQNCFTVKASTDIASARNIMDGKGVRFLPVVVDMPSLSESTSAPGGSATAAKPRSSVGTPARSVVGVLSRDSVHVAGRLTETERAMRDLSSPPQPAPLVPAMVPGLEEG